jgi:hypothetical protein
MTLSNTSLTLPAALSVGTSISTNTLTATGNITAANLYSKTITDNLLNNKLNNNTGAVSTSIKNNSNEDVVIFKSDKVVDLKGNVNVSNNLAVNGTSVLSNTLKIKCAGNGGNIRVVPENDTDESSIGFYRYIDMRENVVGAMWLIGQNCWETEGFSIGTPGLDACLHINRVGDVSIPVSLATPIIQSTIVVSDIVRVVDNIEAVGAIYSSVRVLNLTAGRVLTFGQIKNGIITCLNTTMSLSLTLPTGNDIDTGMPTVGYNQSFQWSVINLSTSTGNINMIASAGHSYIGNSTLGPNASYRFLTVKKSADTAITYRICGNSTVGGGGGGDINPFWCAGKISANGDIISSKGRYPFTCVKSGTSYTITPTISFGNMDYIINITSQVDTSSGYCRISSSTMTNDAFIVATYVNNSQAASIFHFSVIQ